MMPYTITTGSACFPLNRAGQINTATISPRQLAKVNLIRTLQDVGMSLTRIKSLIDQRTPEHIDTLLATLIKQLDGKIDGLSRARKLLTTLHGLINTAMNLKEEHISI